MDEEIKLTAHLVDVTMSWEGDGLVQDEGGDADQAHADPDDGDRHLGALLGPEQPSGEIQKSIHMTESDSFSSGAKQIVAQPHRGPRGFVLVIGW